MSGVLRRRLDVGVVLACLLIIAAIVVGVVLEGHPAASAPQRIWARSKPFPLPSIPGGAGAPASAEQSLPAPLANLRTASTSATDSLPPPDWVQPGTRLSFYSAAASVAQSRFAWVEDPDGPWVDPRTGTHYRRTDETGESMGWASGDGFAQLDVLGVDGTDVALTMTLYAIDHERKQLVPGATVGAEVPGGEIDGTWVNPARLAQLENAQADGLLVLTGPYPLNGTTYDAVSFAVTSPDSYSQYTYDQKTGVLLAATTKTTTASSLTTGSGNGTPGNTQLTVTFFAGIRQRTVPGLDGASPDWVARTPSLAYAGTYHWVNPVDPGSGTYDSPMSMAVSLQPGGPGWASYSARTMIQALGSSSTGRGLTGPTGLFWLSPETIAALGNASPGQVIDKDPVTGEQLSVEATGRDVTLVSRLPGITSEMEYDATTGALTSYVAQVPGSGTTIQLHLQGVP